MRNKKRQAEIELRRKQVTANLLAGLNYREMAEALDVSLGTIAWDVKVIFSRWQKSQVQKADQWVTLEIRRIDRAINAIWKNVTAGELGAIDRLIKLQERRARYLNLDAQENQTRKIDLTSGGKPLSWADFLRSASEDDIGDANTSASAEEPT